MAIKVTKAEKKLIYNKKLCSLLDEYIHLNIPTKINKDIVEIITPVELIKKGGKVGSSEVALLAKLGIRSFSYGLVVLSIYDNGSVFSPEMLNLTEDDLVDKFAAGVSMVASLSLVPSYPTLAATPWVFINTYKDHFSQIWVAPWVFINTYKNLFTPTYKLKEYLKDPSKFDVVVAPVALAENAVIPSTKEEEKVDPTNGSNDDDLGFSLFD
ncbi:60S acidic ribosomal protein P0-like [Asparagus officinalis]|uniref:60S acidic ribosomal protein P0-like n=1 Tax=Asparagus officinalis TaxID=4686 RepID=UPI00098E14E1|nr:60S acidic ribosomal protein P0-like [Asparagus officinalis]